MEFGRFTTYWANRGLTGCNYFLKAANIDGLFTWDRDSSWWAPTAALPIRTLLKLAHQWCWSMMISTVLILTHQGYGSFCNFFQRLSRRSIDVTRIELISLALQCHHILLSFIVYLDLGCHSFGLLLLLNCIIVKVVWWNITLSLMVVWRRGSTLPQEVLSDMSAAHTVTIGVFFAKPLNEVRHYVWHHHHCLCLIA